MSAVETTLESHHVYDGKILSLRVDRVAIAGGGEAVREIVGHPGGVAVVALDDAGQVLLARQYRYAVGSALLELPAGTLQAGELPAEGAVRELEEETGYRAAHVEPLCRFYPSPGYTSELLYLFLATGLTPVGARPEADERIDVIPTAWDDAMAMVARGEICDAMSIIGLLLVQTRRADGER
jgi:ADP-ribose pyrophosphatase